MPPPLTHLHRSPYALLEYYITYQNLEEGLTGAHRNIDDPGRYKTQELITRNYWWPYIQSDIRKYVEGCQPCQQGKTKKGRIHAPLQPNAIPEQPWEHISVDFITGLPASEGYDAIMVVVDRFTKYIVPIPTNGELSSLGTTKLFRDNVESTGHGNRKPILCMHLRR